MVDHPVMSARQKFCRAVVVAAGALISSVAVAVEEAPHEVVIKEGPYELRDYAPRILAEIRVEGDFKSAGNAAFQDLFGYISGDNRQQQDIAMTAPVSQQATAARIDMTAPVSQQKTAATDGAESWDVSFLLPPQYTPETAPLPTNPDVKLRTLPAMRMAAVRFSGFWSEENFASWQQELETWVIQQGWEVTGDATWARYNPPFTPWFMRRNEVLLPVSQE